MGLKAAGLEAVKWVLVALVLGVGIGVGSGQAEPYLSPADLPGGPPATFAGMLVGVVVVIYGIGYLQEGVTGDEWEAAGRHSGLQPADDGGHMRLPDLTGTVDGRAVMARTERHKRKRTEEGGTKRVRYTLIEASLGGPADEGVLVGGDDSRMRAKRGRIDFADVVENAAAVEGLVTAETGDRTVVGTSAAAAQAVTDGAAGEALAAIETLNLAYVGDATGVVGSYAVARNEELEGSMFEFPVEELVERVPGDATSVTLETRDLLLNVDEFRRHVLAAVAIANAVEAATERRSAAE